MHRTEYVETDTTPTTIEKEAIYIGLDLGNNDLYGNKCFFILEKYNNYRFEEHIRSLRDEFGCQSYSSILFSIIFMINENEKKFFLFTAILEIPDRDEIEYSTSTIYEDTESRENVVDELLKNNLYDRVFIKAEMSTKFYINRSLDIMNQYEEEVENLFDEGYDEDESPSVIVEIPFISDNCSICLSAIPNILNIPCLHLSVCSQCEEIGKLIKCSVCRKKIERKVKI